MAIFLRRNVVDLLVEKIYGSYDDLAAVWEDHEAIRAGSQRAPSRSTIYRWLTDGVPTPSEGSDHRFFTLCGLLDADPLTIFDFHRNGYFSKFAKLRQLVYLSRKAQGGLATLLDMYKPSDQWPSDLIAYRCFGHGWRAHHLTNRDNWNNGNYIQISLHFTESKQRHPYAAHIAYRRIGVPDTMWRYYGTVLGIDNQTELYSESGTFQTSRRATNDVIEFRTYFGGRPVEWRIASLHDFSMSPLFPSYDESIVTFTW